MGTQKENAVFFGMRVILHFFLLISFSFCLPASGQRTSPNYYRFENLTTKEGLSGNEVVKVVKDKHGFIWAATHNGLSRFDGKSFTNYSFKPGDSTGLRSIWTTDLLLDDHRNLWVSTEWGVAWYDEHQNRFRYLPTKEPLTILYKAPMLLSKSGRIWVATENGLFYIQPQQKTIHKTKVSRISDPQSLMEDDKGNIWVGTRGTGMYWYAPATNKWHSYQHPSINKYVHAMQMVWHHQSMWIAGSEGLIQIEQQRKVTMYTAGKGPLANQQFAQLMFVLPVKIDDHPYLLCGTYDKKLLLFDPTVNGFVYDFTAQGKAPKSVYYAALADGRLVWLATQNGLCKMERGFEGYDMVSIPIAKENRSALIQSLLVDKKVPDRWWLFSEYNGGTLLRYNNASQQTEQTIHTKTRLNTTGLITGLAQTNNGQLFTSADKYINEFDANGRWSKEYKLSEVVNCLLATEENNIWLGTENGIAKLKRNSGTVEYFPHSYVGTEFENNSYWQQFPVMNIAMDNHGTIWLANLKYGLFSFDTSTKKYTVYRQPFSGQYATQNRLSDVIAASPDSIWMSTMAGISLYIPSSKIFYNYSSKQGLKSTYIYAIDRAANGDIWGRGNTGVFHLSVSNGKFTNYDLPASFDDNYYLQEMMSVGNGAITGVDNGIIRFNNQLLSANPLLVQVTSMQVNNKAQQNFQQIVTLAHDENNIRFDFTTVHYGNANIQFQYRLTGVGNTAWINNDDKRNVSFSNLSPGNYTLQVRAILNSTLTGKPTQVQFRIRPAFWQHWWFNWAVALLFISAVIAFYKWRYSQWQKVQQLELEKTAQQLALEQAANKITESELALLRSQMNPHFIFNSLNSVQKFIWESKEEDAAEYLAKFAKLMRAILEYSRHEFVTLRQEVETIRLYMELEHRRSKNRFDYVIRIDETLKQDQTLFPPLLLQPFIENAIWHGLSTKQEQGQLHISIERQQECIVATIDDNGIGRNAAKENRNARQSYGIEITRQRLLLLFGPAWAAQQPLQITDKMEAGQPAGTLITITIPLKQAPHA